MNFTFEGTVASVTSSDESAEWKADIERFWNTSSVSSFDLVEVLSTNKTNMFCDILEKPEVPQNMFILSCVAMKKGLFKDSSFVCRCYVSFFIYFKMNTVHARRRLLIIQKHNKAYKSHLELNAARNSIQQT